MRTGWPSCARRPVVGSSPLAGAGRAAFACSQQARGGRSGERDVYLEVVFGVGSLRLERGGARLLAVDPRGVERRVRIDREREGVDRLGEANRRG